MDHTELTGHGTVYDGEENELGTVAYRLTFADPAAADAPVMDWSGELTFESEDVLIEAGPHILELEDGSRTDIDVEPAGSSSGAVNQVAFTGIGAFNPGSIEIP